YFSLSVIFPPMWLPIPIHNRHFVNSSSFELQQSLVENMSILQQFYNFSFGTKADSRLMLEYHISQIEVALKSIYNCDRIYLIERIKCSTYDPNSADITNAAEEILRRAYIKLKDLES